MKKLLLILVVAVVGFAVQCSTYTCEIESPGDGWTENTNRIPKFEKEYHVVTVSEGTSVSRASAGILVEETSSLWGDVTDVVDDIRQSFGRDDLYKKAAIKNAIEKNFHGVPWTVLEISFNVKDVLIHQDYYLTKKGNRVFTALFTAAGDDNYRKFRPDFISMIEKAKFTEK